MFKRISILLIVLLTILCFVGGASATAPGLFVVKDAANTYIKYVDADDTAIMTIDDTDGVTIAVSIIGNTYTSMTVTATTDATSITTGSITTAGGASIADQLWLGDDIDMTTNTTGIYDITLKTNQADALSIVDDAPGELMLFCTTTGSQLITITPATTITGVLTASGGITVGVSEDRLIVQNTFAADANVSTYEYGQYNGMIFNTDITTGKMVSGMKIAMEGTADYNSGSAVWPLWIDIQNTGTNNSDNFDMARFSVQAGACLPNSYISFQTASPGVDFLFEIVGDVSPFYGNAGEYTTADGYLLVNTPDGTRRIALYAAVD